MVSAEIFAYKNTILLQIFLFAKMQPLARCAGHKAAEHARKAVQHGKKPRRKRLRNADNSDFPCITNRTPYSAVLPRKKPATVKCSCFSLSCRYDRKNCSDLYSVTAKRFSVSCAWKDRRLRQIKIHPNRRTRGDRNGRPSDGLFVFLRLAAPLCSPAHSRLQRIKLAAQYPK